MPTEEIILEIEETPIVCKKQDLITNSDYFKAMLEGEFMEKDKETIKLQDVDLKAMNIILTLLWDETFLNVIAFEDILTVLQAACMLQFINISHLCIERITQILNPKNCLKVWLLTEQLSIKPLYLKAKSMALEEFTLIRDTECLNELTLEQFCGYIGHVNLRAENEFLVFQTLTKWWYENSHQFQENIKQTLFKLLSCVDFQILSETCIKEMITYPDICQNEDVKYTLLCLYNLKSGMSTELFSQDCRNVAESLYSTKCRKIASYPCVLVQRMSSECPNKKSILGRDHRVAYYDGFKRKRFYSMLEPDKASNFLILYCAPKLNTFRKFLSIDDSKCQNLEGFKLLGYKEYVFMYGGEFLIGRGSWNLNFWVYDTIRENWERKSVLPAPRRHFETCIVGSKVFIIGGIGKFRITQENLFWYDFKEDKWSQMIALPFYDRQLKCCSFSDKFFILSIKDKCGYFYAQNELGNWTWLTRQVVVEDEVLSREKVFGLLSYKNKLYIKGKKLIEFGLDGDKIVLLSIKNITNVEYDDLEVILCYDTIYTLYRNRNVDTTAYTLEKYNLETGDTEFISRDIEDIMEIDGERFQLNSNMKIFSFNHYSAVENNDVINNSFS